MKPEFDGKWNDPNSAENLRLRRMVQRAESVERMHYLMQGTASAIATAAEFERQMQVMQRNAGRVGA